MGGGCLKPVSFSIGHKAGVLPGWGGSLLEGTNI